MKSLLQKRQTSLDIESLSLLQDDLIVHIGMHLQIMMTSSNGFFSALLALCVGNSPVPGEFSSQRPLTRSFDVFFDLCLNKRASKQSRRR